MTHCPLRQISGEQQSALVARVVKPFGASIRVAPSLDAPVLLSTRCGDLWPVTSLGDGWVAIGAADQPKGAINPIQARTGSSQRLKRSSQ